MNNRHRRNAFTDAGDRDEYAIRGQLKCNRINVTIIIVITAIRYRNGTNEKVFNNKMVFINDIMLEYTT